MNKVKFVLFSAGISLALAFAFGCSSGGGGNTEQSYNYCVMADNTCLAGPFTVNSCKGQPSNSCPNGSSPSVGGSSSSVSSSSSKGSSSSSGGGGSFNENSQIYKSVPYCYDNGTTCSGAIGEEAYKGSGIINIYVYDRENDERKIVTNAGSVTNGIVKLELPQTIPDEYLREIDDPSDDPSCTYFEDNKGLKIFSAKTSNMFILTDSKGDLIGRLWTPSFVNYNDRAEYGEGILYWYFSKAGKITCKYEDNEEGYSRVQLYNIDAKKGWNVLYNRENINRNNQGEYYQYEYSTNNILTKEKDLKWVISLEDED